MSRTDVTRAITAYIKDKGLKDPENGRVFSPDPKLAKVLGDPIYPIVKDAPNEKGYGYFNLQKYLTPHFPASKAAQAAAAAAAASN